MSEPGNAAKSGSQTSFTRLEALELLPLPICKRNGVGVDLEHASDFEFTAWLRWNGIPFIGLQEWTFDSKCAIINYALQHGLKPRLIERPGNCLGIVWELFVWPEQTQEAERGESDRLHVAVEVLRSKLDATDEEVRAALNLRTLEVAHFWKIKARKVLGLPLDGGESTPEE